MLLILSQIDSTIFFLPFFYLRYTKRTLFRSLFFFGKKKKNELNCCSCKMEPGDKSKFLLFLNSVEIKLKRKKLIDLFVLIQSICDSV